MLGGMRQHPSTAVHHAAQLAHMSSAHTAQMAQISQARQAGVVSGGPRFSRRPATSGVAAREGIALDPGTETGAFAAALLALAPPQRLRLLHAFIVILLAFHGSQSQGAAQAIFDGLAVVDALAVV